MGPSRFLWGALRSAVFSLNRVSGSRCWSITARLQYQYCSSSRCRERDGAVRGRRDRQADGGRSSGGRPEEADRRSQLESSLCVRTLTESVCHQSVSLSACLSVISPSVCLSLSVCQDGPVLFWIIDHCVSAVYQQFTLSLHH